MKTAIYFTDSEPSELYLFVKEEHGDKTVDLVGAANDKAPVVIGKCPVSTEPRIGCCILAPHPDKTGATVPEPELTKYPVATPKVFPTAKETKAAEKATDDENKADAARAKSAAVHK